MYNSLKRRSHKLREALNNMPNTTCTEIDGALYAFPKVNPASALRWGSRLALQEKPTKPNKTKQNHTPSSSFPF
jgi:aspartate/methionine/tyrosine aminotransferase